MTPLVTVLAVGNPIMADDGIGPAVLGQLVSDRPTWRDDPRVEVVDGGIDGMSLLPVVEDAQRLVIIDALVGGPAAGATPGTVLRFDGDQVPRLLSAKLSPHQVGLLDVLSGARLGGREPEAITVVGIVPALVDLRVGLSPEVAEAVPEAARLVAEVVDGWLS